MDALDMPLTVDPGVFGVCMESVEEAAGDPIDDREAVEALEGMPIEVTLEAGPRRPRPRVEWFPDGGRLAGVLDALQRLTKSS